MCFSHPASGVEYKLPGSTDRVGAPIHVLASTIVHVFIHLLASTRVYLLEVHTNIKGKAIGAYLSVPEIEVPLENRVYNDVHVR